jgi:hypothetical protein
MAATILNRHGRNGAKEVARPLKVLVPLIRQDLRERQRVRDEASEFIEIKIGGELLEAKSRVKHGQWANWLKRNFSLSQETARGWMRASEKFNAGVEFKTLSQAKGDHRKNHESKWTRDVRTRAEQARAEAEWRQRMKGEWEEMMSGDDDERRSEEREAERKLALKLIDIGYKVLAVELHPDKGGSHEAMQRLNAVREWLKNSATGKQTHVRWNPYDDMAY